MSHFTVLVIGENPEKQLKPYDENIEVPPYDKGEVSAEDIQEFITHYAKGGEEISIGLPAEFYKDKIGPDYLTSMYKKYGKKWNGGRWQRHTDGTWHEYSTYNPKSKWDWYLLGGRWTGFFKLKGNLIGKTGMPGIMTESAKPGYADQAFKKDIDFEKMRQDAANKAAEAYDYAMSVIGHLPENEPWDSVLFTFGKENIDRCRDFYNRQARVKAWHDDKLITNKYFGYLSSPEDVNMPREQYLKQAYEGAIGVWTIVKDSVWYEKGEMGWWGMSRNEKDQDVWNAQVTKMIDELPDNTLFSLYDCHI